MDVRIYDSFERSVMIDKNNNTLLKALLLNEFGSLKLKRAVGREARKLLKKLKLIK